MVEPRKCLNSLARMGGTLCLLFLLLALLGGLTLTARAALQFDVFPGFDGTVPEASWFPVVCEIKNDGPSFNGVIEITAGGYNTQNQMRRAVVELPTGTLKRLVIPVFSSARYQSSWDVRLLDDRGRVHAEQLGLRPRRSISSSTILLGALPRVANGLPVVRQILSKDSDLQPATVRLQPSLFPDNPLVLEGLDCIYLNSEKAPELNVNQYNALLAWLNNGGHLIIAVEQISDVNGTEWLRDIVPVKLADVQTVTTHPALQQWLRDFTKAGDASGTRAGKGRGANRNGGSTSANPFSDLADDATFEAAPLQVVTGKLRKDADVVADANGVPLVVSSTEGRGRVSTILFSPEREPMRSWKNLPTFWAKLTEVPSVLYQVENSSQRGGWSVDGVFGAMIDSKQIRKLPVEWLLLLLIVYLVVIGPLDQYWLKRIKRPMLTWVTFPCYVVLFSLLIYFIGYKLRAGESEWNELHLVDVISRGEVAKLRGRTYASIYSPVNQAYRVENQQDFSTFRSEFQGGWSGGGQESERANVLQSGDNFKAEIFVPVWTSQLFISDWWQSAALPLEVSVVSDGADWAATVINHLERAMSHAQIVVGGRVVDIGELPAGQTKTFKLGHDQGTALADFVRQHGGSFQGAAQSRQRAFGASSSGQVQDAINGSMAACFVSQLSGDQGNFSFISPPGLDLSAVAGRGNAILLAWSADYSPIVSINKFSPRRSHKDTLWRMSIPINAPARP
ncbi:MAG: hypothetical protein JWR19_1982 [Pedosphaera sp.]|nr:hypothetical protein [Pedosphaera sp.]